MNIGNELSFKSEGSGNHSHTKIKVDEYEVLLGHHPDDCFIKRSFFETIRKTYG